MALYIARFVLQAEAGTTDIPAFDEGAFTDTDRIADVHVDTVLTLHAAGGWPPSRG